MFSSGQSVEGQATMLLGPPNLDPATMLFVQPNLEDWSLQLRVESVL